VGISELVAHREKGELLIDILLVGLKERDHLKEVGLDGRIKTNYILNAGR
jgi:hypothetical protein